mmetsp:Transcript_41888/g.64109  ORF Transcript_41888/g.64109 Transcript_41888/m.64109 type:complete len:229 (-) Transcript_41888:364-1050(-)
MFDTGSSIMYMLTTNCEHGCPQSLAKFDVNSSTSLVEQPEKRQDQNYGRGFVTGDVAKDQMCFEANHKSDGNSTPPEEINNSTAAPPKLECPQYEFLAVDKGNELGRDRFSGIVGLSPPTDDNSTVAPFLNQMNKMFSFYLSKGAGSTGNLMIGGFNLDKYARDGAGPEDIIWTNLVGEGWTIPLDGLRFSEGSFVHVKSEEITLDTGLSYALVPPRDIESLTNALKE